MRFARTGAHAAVLETLDWEASELDEELWSEWSDVEALLGDWRKEASFRRLHRELDARYGPFRDVVLHPWSQAALRYAAEEWREVEWVGGPVAGLTTVAVVLFTLWRAKVRLAYVALAMLFLFQVHPVLVVAVMGVYGFWRDRRRAPLGLKAARPRALQPLPPRAAAPLDRTLLDAALASELQARDWDHLVLGSSAGALHSAVSLARLGRRVLVLEPGACLAPDLRHVDAVTGEELDASVPSVGNVKWYNSFLRACVPGLRWQRRGREAEGFTHTMVFAEAGGEHLMLRLGRDALIDDVTMLHPTHRAAVESLVANVEQSRQSSATHFMLKALPAWSKRLAFLDQSLADAFANLAANNVANALTRVFKGPGPEGGDDAAAAPGTPAARSLLGALFHVEAVAASELSVAAFVLSISRSLHGLYRVAFAGDTDGTAAEVGPATELARRLVEQLRSLGGEAVCLAETGGAPAAWRLFALSSDGRHRVAGVSGSVGDGSKFSFRCSGEVVSGLGLTATVHRLPEDVALPKVCPGLERLRDQRPRAKVVFRLRLRNPRVSLPSCGIVNAAYAETAGDQRHSDGFWRIDFPEPGAGRPATAVVELELLNSMLRPRERAGAPAFPEPSLNGPHRAALVKRASRVLLDACGDLLVPEDGLVTSQVIVRDQYSALLHDVTRYTSPLVRPDPFGAPQPASTEGAAEAASESLTGLLLTGADLTMDTFDGDLFGSYLCLHRLCGYGPVETFAQGRNLFSDMHAWAP